MRFPFFNQGDTYVFYMRGGHAVLVEHVKKIELTRHAEGGYSAYSITWMPGKNKFLSLSIRDIVAVQEVH